MLTDRPPLKASYLAGFLESDRRRTIELPRDERLRRLGKSIESAMKGETSVVVRHACAGFLAEASYFYGVPRSGIRVLAARPLRVHEGDWATELFGDYTPDTILIRVCSLGSSITAAGTSLPISYGPRLVCRLGIAS